MTREDNFGWFKNTKPRPLDKILALSQGEVENITKGYNDKYNRLLIEFKDRTSFTDVDIKILLLAAMVQSLRWSLLSNSDGRFVNAKDADKVIEDGFKRIEKVTEVNLIEDLSVPYDVVRRSNHFKLMYPGVSTGLSGCNHRYKTLGHDPLVGLIVGTSNIATSTLCVNDFASLFPSYRIKNKEIDEYTNIFAILNETYSIFNEKPQIIGLSFLKQIIHMGSDAFTKQGLPLPIINVISPETSNFLLGKNVRIDLYSVTRNVALSIVINKLVEMLHRLFYDSKSEDKRLYEVRTRKILMYSNTLSTVINVGYTSVTGDLNRLDVGGIAVTLWRILNDCKTIHNIKKEFIERTLSNDFKKEEDEINQELAKYGFAI